MAHEKDWETHARKSRSSAFLTFIGAVIVIGSLVFSFSLLQKLNVQNELLQAQKDVIESSRDSLQVLSSEIISLNKRIVEHDHSEHTDESDIVGTASANLNQQFDAKIKELENLVQGIPTSAASVTSEENFVMCRNVVKSEPVAINTLFEPGKVYFWARVHTPKKATLVLKWYNSNQEVIRTKQIAVKSNMQTGYRVYDYKTFRAADAGDYKARLFNSAGEIIAERDFSVK